MRTERESTGRNGVRQLDPHIRGSYTEAEMLAKLGVAAGSSDYFKVKEINALLLTKGVKARGKKAQKCKQGGSMINCRRDMERERQEEQTSEKDKDRKARAKG